MQEDDVAGAFVASSSAVSSSCGSSECFANIFAIDNRRLFCFVFSDFGFVIRCFANI